VTIAKQIISSYEDMEELIKLGAYRKGSDPNVDNAIDRYPHIESFLTQQKDNSSTIEESFELLASALGMSYEGDKSNNQDGDVSG